MGIAVTEKELCEYCATADCETCKYKDVCVTFYFVNNCRPYFLLVPYDESKGVPTYNGNNPDKIYTDDNVWIKTLNNNTVATIPSLKYQRSKIKGGV